MAHIIRSSVAILLLALLVAEMSPKAVEGFEPLNTVVGLIPAGGRTCDVPSSNFRGMCWSDSHGTCDSVCKSEGYLGGRCSGFRRHCKCSKPC